MTRFLFVLTLWLLGVTGALAQSTSAALVIGNGAYAAAAPKPSATDSARIVAAALKGSGVKVTEVLNADAAALRAELAAWSKTLKPGDAAIVYFAGHAVAAPALNRAEGADNYLLGVDAAVSSPAAAAGSGVSLAGVLQALNVAKAGQQVIILDAGAASGIAGAPPGLTEPTSSALRTAFVAYAAAPGRAPEPGLFAPALAAALAKPGLPMSELFLEVSAEVQRTSAGRQTPYASGSGGSARLVLRPAASRETDLATFTTALACGTQACLKDAAAKVTDLKLKAELQRQAALVDVDSFDPGAVGRGDIGAFTVGPQGGPSVLPPEVQKMIAANNKTAAGNLALGAAFFKGENGFPQSDVDALFFFMAAEVRGEPTAAYMVGWWWHTGRKGVEGVNHEIARDYFEKAAAGGNGEAMYSLAIYYAQGLGGPKDEAKAKDWLRKAAAAGQVDAKAAVAGS